MKTTRKFLAPIYGLRKSLKQNLRLDSHLLFRNIHIPKEDELFKKYGLKGNYIAVLEIEYEYDSSDPSEPFPGIFLKVINKFDASLVVFGSGKVGVAALLPSPDMEGFPGGGILYSAKVRFDEALGKEINNDFKIYYINFLKAYDTRPVAFDVFRRSQDRFANNDKTIDSCIVLESIFVPLGEKTKKPFILSGMKIMGFGAKDVQSIDDLIEYRNSIIHADRKKQLRLLSGSKYTFTWFEGTFNIVREILSKYVNNPWD